MTSETKKRLDTLSTVCPTAMLALGLSVSPRHGYYVFARLLGLLVPVHQTSDPGPIDEILAWLAVCMMPLVAVDSWRATRVLTMTLLPSLIIYGGMAIVMLMPTALVPLTETFGDLALVAAFLIWPIVTFSIVAFVVALAQVDAEQQGRQPHTLFLAVLHHFGGFVGVYFASTLFPGSKTCAEMCKVMPRGLVFLVSAIAVCVLMKLL